MVGRNGRTAYCVEARAGMGTGLDAPLKFFKRHKDNCVTMTFGCWAVCFGGHCGGGTCGAPGLGYTGVCLNTVFTGLGPRKFSWKVPISLSNLLFGSPN